MKIAALDLGSNTFLCLIAEVTVNGLEKTYFDEVEVVRLGEGLSSSKKFQPQALERADKCLQKFSDVIRQHKPEKILAMATAAARDAENKEELFQICSKHQIPVEIISGDKEAQITYEGATSGLSDTKQSSANSQKALVLDIGGGSTEFIKGQGPQILAGLSAAVGCVKWTEKYFKNKPPTKEELQAAEEAVDQIVLLSLEKVGRDFQSIVAVAGTPTALATAHFKKFDPKLIDGFQLTVESLKGWKKVLSQSTVQQILEMGIPQGRADVILIGVLILESVLRQSGLNSMSVSTRGVRYGVALEVFRRA